MATPSAMEELEALQLARSRLEAALSKDENWRALQQSRARSDGAADSAAHRARDTRLEMALAGNAHFQAWKHLNGAIDALHARNAALAQAAEPLVRPATAGAAVRAAAALPDDVEDLLRSEASGDTSRRRQPGPVEPEPAATPSSSARLRDRLDRVEGAREERDRQGLGQRRARQQPAPPVAADPPEATVTFVVRETHMPTATESLAGLGGERSPALFERLRSLQEVPEPSTQDQSLPSSAATEEEAEVTIMSAEVLQQRREDDERAGIVRRFRKALSGD